MRFGPDPAADAGSTAVAPTGGDRHCHKPDLLDLYAVLAESAVELTALADAVYAGQACGQFPPPADVVAARESAHRVLTALAALE